MAMKISTAKVVCAVVVAMLVITKRKSRSGFSHPSPMRSLWDYTDYTVIILTQAHLGKRRLELCSALASVVDYAPTARVNIVWSGAQEGSHWPPIQRFSQICHSSQRASVLNVLQEVPLNVTTDRCTLGDGCTPHGLAYYGALSYSLRLSSNIVVVESDTVLLPNFDKHLRGLLRSVDAESSCIDLYSPGDLQTTQSRRHLQASFPRNVRWDNPMYKEGLPTTGSQGFFFGRKFLRKFVLTKLQKYDSFYHADLEIRAFCDVLRKLKVNARDEISELRCGKSTKSLVQHIGFESEIFGDEHGVNARFHSAEGVSFYDPKRVIDTNIQRI